MKQAQINRAHMDWLRSVYDMARIGERLYTGIIKEELSRKGTGIIYSPANVGDTVWLAALAAEYKRYHGYERLIFIVRKRQEDMLPLFPGIDEIMPLGEEVNTCLRYYVMVQRLYEVDDNFRYGHFPTDLIWEPPYRYLYPPCSGDTFEKQWDAVLGLPFYSPKSEILMEQLDGNLQSALKKMVLLMPGSFTITGIPEAFWEKAAAAIRERGYTVFTNYSGLPYDRVIKNTERMEISLREIAAASPYFASIIGIRSGICDLLSMTGCNLNVLYPAKTVPEEITIAKGILKEDVRDLSEKSRIQNLWYHEDTESLLLEKLLEDLKAV